jgi:glycosyltransferase involved in cell wall biosynthesis
MECLYNQTLQPDLYEIIVVNNACTDDTDEVLVLFQSAHPSLTVIRVYEERQGLAHSRNTGWKHARGVYVVFLDDDCIPSKTWLMNLLDSFEKVTPEPWSVGGPIYPTYVDPKPNWFKDEYEKWTWGEKARCLLQGESFFGGNMAFKKSILERYGGFDTRVGMSGINLSTGEETSLYERIWQIAGPSCIFYYCPEAIMYHRISGHRMTFPYQLKRAFAEGQAVCCRRNPKNPKSLVEHISQLSRAIAALFWHGGRAAAETRPVPYWVNWFVEMGKVLAFQTGRVAGSLGLLVSVRSRPKV